LTETKTFADLGVDQHICDALAEVGITTPFPIQELTLPLALSGADIIGQARTGTGKTLAFAIPLLQRVDAAQHDTQALVIVPTRELCLQVRGDLAQAAVHKDVDVVAVYGGRAIGEQEAALRAGATIVVGTPGRLLDLMGRGSLDLSRVTSLVLDEADEMLDLGFLPDVERLVQATAGERQTLLFSATMPAPIVGLARRYMHKPTFLRADVEEARIAPATRQYFFSCHRLDKPAVLARILQAPERGLCVVFTRTKRMADVLVEDLRTRGVEAAPIHSDLRQEARERALSRFRRGKVDVLVATEVAARGLDIEAVTHVINYDCPDDEKMYLHRVGRTGRAGAAGIAITLAIWNELARLEMIKKALDVNEPTHEVFSTSPILEELFDLPARPGLRRQAEAPKQPAASTSTPEGADAGGRRVRVRRRTVLAGDPTAASAAPDGPPPHAAAPEEPAAARQPEQPPVPTRAPSGRRIRRRAATAPTERAARGDRPAPTDRAGPRRERSGQPESPRRRPSTSRPSAAARTETAARPEPRPRSRGAADASRPGRAGGAVEALRGSGRPALNRPIAIDHLP
jgi:superfamily II DNA/RNA helicase